MMIIAAPNFVVLYSLRRWKAPAPPPRLTPHGARLVVSVSVLCRVQCVPTEPPLSPC